MSLRSWPTRPNALKAFLGLHDVAEIVEIITHVGLNILTNLIGKATRVDIDFPKVSLQSQAANTKER